MTKIEKQKQDGIIPDCNTCQNYNNPEADICKSCKNESHYTPVKLKECKHSLLEDVKVKEQCCNCGYCDLDEIVNILDESHKTATIAVYKPKERSK